MTYYERLRRKKLGDLLVDEEVASKEAVITAMHEHHQTNVPLSQVLVAGGELSEFDLARIMVEQYQLPFLDLVNYTYHRDLIAQFPARLLHDARVVPLDSFGDVTCFVVQEFPTDDIVAELNKHAGGQKFFYAAMAAEIRQALRDHVPLSDEEFAGDAAEAELAAPVAVVKMQEDGAWKELFDTANEAIVSELPEGEAEGAAAAANEGDEGAEVPALPGGEDDAEAEPEPDGEMPDWLSGE